LEKGDRLYLFTDGYADQFGGPKGKKFKYRQLEEVLLSTIHLTLNDQKQALENAFDSWKANHEQVDDVCIIGISV
jgi:serine phosphatase RsbU (regulator of sigma subunit)